jgi:hypothetical protein
VPLLVLLIACSSAGVGPQTGGFPAGSRRNGAEELSEEETAGGLALVCEVYCSKTRTANARLRWKLVPGRALDAAEAGNLSTAVQRLETTVYKDGFAKDLYMSWPMSPAGADRAAPSGALSKQPQGALRAYQMRIVEIDWPKSSELFAAGTAETVAVVENLEPGVNYTWRMAVETDASKLVSPVVTCQAPVCPADRVRKRKP